MSSQAFVDSATAEPVRFRVFAVVAIMAGVALASIAFGHIPGPQSFAFLPLIMGSIIVTELMSACLFFAYFVQTRFSVFAFAGIAYALSGLLAVPYLLTFPGVFSASGLFGANEQSALALWFLWHAAFALFILLYGAAHRPLRARNLTERSARTLAITAAVGSIALAFFTGWLVTAHRDVLPELISANGFTRLSSSIALPIVVLLDLMALLSVARFTRLRTGTQLWLFVAVVASLCDALIGILCPRYAVGWYAGKLFAFVSSAAVLGQYFFETIKLNGRLRAEIAQRARVESALAQARDEAVEASRMKSRFVATMSHEIRTPMNGVIGMTELLLETKLTPEQRDYAATIHGSGHALMTVINDILDFSKMEAGKVDIQIDDFSLETTIEAVTTLFAAQAASKGVGLYAYVDPDIPAVVRGDGGRVRQILLNLLGNALKFTSSGRIVVRALHVRSDERRATVRFEVEDTGIGMDDAELARVFDPFTQASGATARTFGGTGLGLAISKHLVELMEGTIGAASATASGSVFWFEVPFARAGREPIRRGLQSRRVLLVCNDRVSDDILSRYLLSWGISVTHASDASQISERIRAGVQRRTPFDLAVVDLDVLPAQEALRALLREIPVVAVGARSQRAQLGDDVEFVAKPPGPSALFDAIVKATTDEGSGVSSLFAEKAEEYRSLGHVRVLLVEDNPVNRRVAALQLAKLGVEVEAVENGREAIKAARGQSFSLILMDCHMPEVDGYQATRAIRQHESHAGGHVPIIALTANALDDDHHACLDAGMDDFLSKPVKYDDLRRMIECWATAGPVQTRS